MSKKEMMLKIKKNQSMKKMRHALNWVYDQLKELSDYLEMGENTALREKCYHAIRYLIAYAKSVDKSWRQPWFVMRV